MAHFRNFTCCLVRNKCVPVLKNVQLIEDTSVIHLLTAKRLPLVSCRLLLKRQFCAVTNQTNDPMKCVQHGHSFQPKKHISSQQNAPDAFTRFSSDIDFGALRDARIKEWKSKGKDVNVGLIVKSIVKEKCDEVFANLNEEDQRKLKVAQLEHDVLYSQGYDIIVSCLEYLKK